MFALLLSATINCQQVVDIATRVVRSVSLTTRQRVEIINVLKTELSSCPIYLDPFDVNKPIKLKAK